MPSTEFLLYLVFVILIGVVYMNYINPDTKSKDKYVIEMLKRQERRELEREQEKQSNSNQNQSCNSPQCMRAGRCVCGGIGGIGGIGAPHPPAPGVLGSPAPVGPLADPLRKFDYDAVHDEFTPPFRRSYYDDYALHPGLYPTYTRGPPGRFRKVGTLIAQGVGHDDKYKFLNLNGREKYPGREYEYFATSVDTESKIKFYIDTKGKEIRDGDNVSVKNLEGYEFVFSEDEDLSPKYDPYFIY